MLIAQNVGQLIGNTPLVRLNKIGKNAYSEIVCKLEYFNPGSSVKDRLAYALFESAKQKGLINTNTVIIEPTSGNTGIGLAMMGAIFGNRIILTMPESTTVKRRKLISAYGAELVLTPADAGMNGAIKKAEQLSNQIPNSYMPQQFNNEANPEFHRKTTATEIWKDTDGKVDIFVAGIGTGGTFTGVSSVLKQKNPKLKAFAVEPVNSAVLSGKAAGKHKIQGIGAGFIPRIMEPELIDEIITVNDDDAFEMARNLAKEEGILCGVSSGANVFAALEIAKRIENKGKRIVVVIPDTGERYLSTGLFQ
ncbi:MAG: cysteine synthase A [Bacteroidetes bacterium 4572_117]|nr:MAG: cysteine synthase A [Bacteroidetes bacterium 4572_117]